MIDSIVTGIARRSAGIPGQLSCAGCASDLTEPFGWCSNCRKGFCLACGRGHYCTPGCQANGCIAGLCVRLVDRGVLSSEWGLPTDVGR